MIRNNNGRCFKFVLIVYPDPNIPTSTPQHFSAIFFGKRVQPVLLDDWEVWSFHSALDVEGVHL